MSEEFIKGTDGHTDGRMDGQTEPLPELLSELKKAGQLYDEDYHRFGPVLSPRHLPLTLTILQMGCVNAPDTEMWIF